jgi:hypothetical protein
MCATYERKTRGPRAEIEGTNPIHINVNVEPINPCMTNKPKRTPPFRQLNFGKGRQQKVHLHKEQQLEEPVQEALFKYLHRADVLVHHSGW